MPNSIDIGDLVQDGVLGLIDAANRFDEDRGIKFETFAERRVRGAMIDALRRDAWPRGVRRQRRELDAAREALRRELGHEPSMADLAARRLRRKAPEPHDRPHQHDRVDVAARDGRALRRELAAGGARALGARFARTPPTKSSKRASASARAIQSLPWREQKVIGLYYYGEVTMKQIGAEIGVNESRVSQLHARAIRRLRDALGEMGPQQVAEMRQGARGVRGEEAEDGEGATAAAPAGRNACRDAASLSCCRRQAPRRRKVRLREARAAVSRAGARALAAAR